jgi:hypothetical protein
MILFYRAVEAMGRVERRKESEDGEKSMFCQFD